MWGLTTTTATRMLAGTMKKLWRTTVWVDKQIVQDLEARYYGLSPSEIIRLCIEYVHETKPRIEVGKTKFMPVVQTERQSS